jgi:NADPH:quinone reductase-like Zn-dependent oxidoreductase
VRAIAWTRYGPPEVLELEEIPKPTPKKEELLIKIHATTAAAGDCEIRALRFSLGLRILVRLWMGLSNPGRKILGQEFAGEVEGMGEDVSLFKKGDRVFGTTGFGFGAYAEYICLPEKIRGRALTTMPANMSYEEAAAVPTGGLEAVHFLKEAGSLIAKRVLINGAGGGIGTFAVQLAKYWGARVTAVDSAGKLDMLRSIGADEVLDYAQQEFTRMGARYDVIFDVAGTSPFSGSVASLTEGGYYLLGNPRIWTRIRGWWTSMGGRKTVVVGASKQGVGDLVFLRELIEAGRIRSVIDRILPLEQIAEGHRYVDAGLARGKVVISL